MKSIFVAAIAAILAGCGAAAESPSDVSKSPATAAPCDAGEVAYERSVDVPLTPYVWDQFAGCRIPDDPALSGRVWCCPPGK